MVSIRMPDSAIRYLTRIECRRALGRAPRSGGK